MKRRKLTDHFTVAEVCRANPGQWQEVGEYNSTQSADTIVKAIQSAYVTPTRRTESAYAPAGAFEATRVLTEFGARVEARYVGSGDEAWAAAVAALTTRRAYLLAAVREYGRPVTTQFAEQVMADSPWPTTGRNTARKDLRGLAKRGYLAPVDTDQGRIYHPTAIQEVAEDGDTR